MIYHIKDGDIKKLLKGELNESLSQKILCHITSCDICSERFANITLEMATVAPPKGMYEQVLDAAAKEKSRNRQKCEILFLYSVRVAAGVCAAIVLMYTGIFKRFANLDSIDMNKLNDASYSISEHLHNNLNEFSNTLFSREEKA